ncbi:unnamed protein product [Arctogadus glacialis]
MPVRQREAQRALELLQRYRSGLGQRARSQGPDGTGPGGPDGTGPGPAEHDLQLQQSLDRVITVFQSQLFNALLDIQEYYELTLQSDSQLPGDPPPALGTAGPGCGPPAELSSQTDLPSLPLGAPPPSGPPASSGSSGPKRKSVKAPAPPVPSGGPGEKAPPRSPSPKVKSRAAPPPVQPRAHRSEQADGALKGSQVAGAPTAVVAVASHPAPAPVVSSQPRPSTLPLPLPLPGPGPPSLGGPRSGRAVPEPVGSGPTSPRPGPTAVGRQGSALSQGPLYTPGPLLR